MKATSDGIEGEVLSYDIENDDSLVIHIKLTGQALSARYGGAKAIYSALHDGGAGPRPRTAWKAEP